MAELVLTCLDMAGTLVNWLMLQHIHKEFEIKFDPEIGLLHFILQSLVYTGFEVGALNIIFPERAYLCSGEDGDSKKLPHLAIV